MSRTHWLLLLLFFATLSIGLKGLSEPVISAEQIQEAIKQLEHPDEKVRWQAALFLKEAGPAAKDSVAALLKAKYEPVNQTSVSGCCHEAIVAIGAPAVAPLATALKDKRNPNRYDAAQLLWRIADKHGGSVMRAAVPALADAVNDADHDVSSFAVHALFATRSHANKAIPALEKALDTTTEPSRRQNVARTLISVAGILHKRAGQVLHEIEVDQQLIQAARGGEVNKARQLLAAGAHVNARQIGKGFVGSGAQYTPLMAATIRGYHETVELLLRSNADVNAKRGGYTALHFAIIHDHDRIVEALQKAGAHGDPNRIRLTNALIAASCKGFVLKDGQPYPQYPGFRPEHIERAESIDVVLSKGASVNWTDPEGYTPLMYAANLGLAPNVKTLLSNGAAVNSKSSSGDSALSLAEDSGHGQVIELLKKAGANR